MKYIVVLNGRKYEVEVEQGEATAVYLGEEQTVAAAAPAAEPAPVPQQVREAARPAKSAKKGDGDPVRCPMPGTILDVRASVNQSVQEGDVLFILEAMKMENEIVAPRAGKITSILTNKGASVQTDQVLATIR